ncbi:MAG: tail fiber domain-containing protein [Alphaproteobacteria bacterium]
MKTNTLTLVLLALLTYFAIPQSVQAVVPAPDGCYPNYTTAEGCSALNFLSTGAGNTGVGWYSLYGNSTGNFNTGVGGGALALNNADSNTAVGAAALLLNTTGVQNTAVGTDALIFNDSGANNTAIGFQTLYFNTQGNTNTAIGVNALVNSLGSRNVALGAAAGSSLGTGDDNIYVGTGIGGSNTESDTIRIGVQGTQTATFIAGISGTSVAGVGVVVDDNGQLGVAPSSRRFKTEIKAMDKASEAILALKPVTFRYKKEIDSHGVPQFGLVAEDVAKVNPDLIVRDAVGKIYTVRYEAVNAMLLNEFLKEHRKVQQLETNAAHQQKQIEALTAGLQKVSAQLELSKAAPQTVLNDQ